MHLALYKPLHLPPDPSHSLSLSFSLSLSLLNLEKERRGKIGRAMADKENCVRITRAVAKRAAAAAACGGGEQPRAKRKRVALSELPLLSNAAVAVSCSDRAQSKPRLRSTKGRNVAETEEIDDPQLCPHYAADIYGYLRSMEAEEKRRPMAGYIEKIQTDVNPNMRGILVDWLVEVAEEYKLVPDTLYLTISYIDRYLSFNSISRQRLQLLGVSAMLIASYASSFHPLYQKYEEISPPNVEDFCYITDNTYTKKQVIEMEGDVLRFLKFEMGNPTIKTFLRRFTKAAEEDDEEYPRLLMEFMGCYLAELSLLEYQCVQFLPSIVAASAVFVARFAINQENPPWSKKLQQYTGYKVSELRECIYLVHDLQLKRRGSNLTAVREKYKQHRFKCASCIIPPAVIPESFLEDFGE
ncbi:Cyclin-A3-4 [Apostasia shenzhenica]|uniref:Cyclin-A3-4 n=1 Tax=Apostasia shenzhenica TaxID=1088818 RepID=A0A2I0AZN9_9ASPA|nr:Cyclin-A3-4 [Apostasia shenzhenica]